MNSILKCFLLINCFSITLLINPSCAQQSLTNKGGFSTQQYIDDYVNMQFDDLAKYYTSESIFQDPTLVLIDKNAAKKVQGIKAILEKLRRNFNGITRQKYTLNTYYKVGDYSIYTGVYDYTQNATAFGGPNVDIQFSLKSTTILKEKEGKVIEHIEYMDYSSWFEQFEAQKNLKNK